MILTLKSFFPAIDKHYHYSYIQLPDVATIKDVALFLYSDYSYIKLLAPKQVFL